MTVMEWFYRGLLLAKQGDFDRACEILVEANEGNSGHIHYKLIKAYTHCLMLKFDKALLCIDEVLEEEESEGVVLLKGSIFLIKTYTTSNSDMLPLLYDMVRNIAIEKIEELVNGPL